MAPPQTRVISLRNVTPSIPENPIHLEELKQDLARMRCEGLLNRPWALKKEQLVQEMLQPERPNIFDGTIRDRPQLWIADLWRDTYRFPRGGLGLANRMEGHHEGRFMHQVDSKDGYSVSDCRVDRHRRLLEFLIPIVHQDKPTRVTITIGNTIFGALDGGREVDWRVVFRDMIQRLAKGVGKPKPTPICSFLFHIYEGQGLLTAEEELDYRTAKEMAGYRITPDPDSRPGSDEDELTPAPAPSPRPGPSRTPTKRRKSTYKAPSGSPPLRSWGPSSPVQGTIKSGSTGTTAKGAATGESTGESTGGRTGVSGQAFRQHRTRIPASSGSIRINGDGVGADRLRAWSKPGGDHPNDPDTAEGPEGGWTPDPDCESHQREQLVGDPSCGPEQKSGSSRGADLSRGIIGLSSGGACSSGRGSRSCSRRSAGLG